MKNIAMRICYDGTAYHGWQRQKNGLTIQQIIEESLSGLIGEDIQVTGCSRTDAGVHALDYVFNFMSETGIPTEKLPYALNHQMRLSDITALEAWETEPDFNARFNSCGKQYVYKIWNSVMNNPFETRYSWHIPYKMDIDAMIKAAPLFEGTHDFAGFMATGGSQKTTVRTVRLCKVEQDSKTPGLISVTVEADAFLYNMVRIITGTLCEVGFSRISPDHIPGIIDSCDRTKGGLTAPPQGLFLKKVYY